MTAGYAVDTAGDTSSFEVHEPERLDEALDLLADDAAGARPVAGGTALSLLIRYGLLDARVLVSLGRLGGELDHLGHDVTGDLRIGATTTLRVLERSSLATSAIPMLADAVRHLANVRVRNVATIGGHLAHADPHMDLPPVLMALDARVRLQSRRGFRWLPVAQLHTGHYETAIADDELLTEVSVPAERANGAAAYRRFTSRSVDDWPLVGVATSGWPTTGGVADVRLAVSGLEGRTRRIPAAEALLATEPPGASTFTRAGELAAELLVDPAEDAYLARLVRVQVRRTLDDAFVTSRGGQP